MRLQLKQLHPVVTATSKFNVCSREPKVLPEKQRQLNDVFSLKQQSLFMGAAAQGQTFPFVPATVPLGNHHPQLACRFPSGVR